MRKELYRYISKYRVLLENLSKEEIEAILRKSIGSTNMPSLARMIKFLELENGSRVSEKFTRNLILLSIIYGSSRGRKGLTFADLVFQALYATLTNNNNKSKRRSPHR
ncbi:MAG: hypothetical protein DRN04_14880 [Thermoprotei archaeon]|nr:MAG: hypothetical protein DRN04_14880 [Thermoprotei archaeon]